MSTFAERLSRAVAAHDSLLCVGLDPVPERLPAGLARDASGVLEFNRCLVEATADLVCCFKPNLAFYAALGAGGWEALAATIEAVPDPVPVVVDAKCGDIGPVAGRWAHAIFTELGADAVTVTPYMGSDAVLPFTRHADRGVFLVCLTSNPGAADFEAAAVEGGGRLWQRVARRALEWNAEHGNCGLVVGATRAESMAGLRRLAPELPFLVPGVGAQGGDLAGSVAGGLRSDGAGLLINASRSVMHASEGADFAEAARAEADRLRREINRVRGVAQSG